MTWCGYKDATEFRTEVENQEPLETAVISLKGGKIANYTHQTNAESGDWLIVDRYTPKRNHTLVRRTIFLSENKITIIKEATIKNHVVSPLRLLSVTRLNDKSTQKILNIDPTLDVPDVQIQLNIDNTPAMRLGSYLVAHSNPHLCDTF